LESLPKVLNNAKILSAQPATSPGGPETKPTASTPALTTLATGTPISAAPGNRRPSVEPMTNASSPTRMTTPRSGRAMIMAADPSLAALRKEITSTHAVTAGARRVSALITANSPLATCPGLSATLTGGGPLMPCAAARKKTELSLGDLQLQTKIPKLDDSTS